MGGGNIPIFFEDSVFWSVVVIVVPIAILGLIWVYLTTDANRASIKSYIAQRGGQVVSIAWEPFMGGRWATGYNIRYLDRAGVLHETFCRISLFSDPYFTLDRIIASPDGSGGVCSSGVSDEIVTAPDVATRQKFPADTQAPLDEIRRLRDEIAGLRRELEEEREKRNRSDS